MVYSELDGFMTCKLLSTYINPVVWIGSINRWYVMDCQEADYFCKITNAWNVWWRNFAPLCALSSRFAPHKNVLSKLSMLFLQEVIPVYGIIRAVPKHCSVNDLKYFIDKAAQLQDRPLALVFLLKWSINELKKRYILGKVFADPQKDHHRLGVQEISLNYLNRFA